MNNCINVNNKKKHSKTIPNKISLTLAAISTVKITVVQVL